MKRVVLNDHKVLSSNSSTYVIAEMSANHGGSLERAIDIVRKAKDAGADCIKLQTYTADTMTLDSKKPYFQIIEGTWKGYSLYKLYEEAHTPWAWHRQLFEEAKKVGIDFLSTPFDKTSVDFLEKLGVEAYKVASFELTDIELLKYIASKNKPIIMSTGMSTIEEIKEAVEAIYEYHDKLVLLKCTSAYPANKKDMNIRTMVDLKDMFGCLVGLSDHSLSHLPVITAISAGAKVIEKHFCISREIDTPDSSFSLEPQELKEMVDIIRDTEAVLGNVRYGVGSAEEKSRVFRRSIFTTKEIYKGELFTEENIRVIRPSHGIAPKHIVDIVGKKALCDIEAEEPLKWEYVDLKEDNDNG